MLSLRKPRGFDSTPAWRCFEDRSQRHESAAAACLHNHCLTGGMLSSCFRALCKPGLTKCTKKSLGLMQLLTLLAEGVAHRHVIWQERRKMVLTKRRFLTWSVSSQHLALLLSQRHSGPLIQLGQLKIVCVMNSDESRCRIDRQSVADGRMAESKKHCCPTFVIADCSWQNSSGMVFHHKMTANTQVKHQCL